MTSDKQFAPINMLKGLCAVLAVWVHAFPEGGRPDCFSLVSVPCLFMVSGSLFKSGVSFRNFAVKKLFRLIIPVLFFVTLLTFFCEETPAWTLPSLATTAFKRLVLMFGVSYLWFMQVMIQLVFVWFAIEALAVKASCWVKALIIMVLWGVSLVMIYGFDSNEVVKTHSLRHLTHFLVALPFVAVGGLVFSIERLKHWHQSMSLMTKCLVCFGSLILWLGISMAGRFDHFHVDFTDFPFLYFPGGVAAFCFVVSLFSIVARLPLLEWLGRNSLPIFAIHPFVVVSTVEMNGWFRLLLIIAVTLPAVLLVKRWAPVLGGYYIPASLRNGPSATESLNLEPAS